MTAATAPSPSPAPSAPHPHPSTPTRQSSSDGSTRRHDASGSSSPAKVTSSFTSTNVTNSNLGTLAKPIDLASPPASPKLSATNAPATVATDSTRPSHQPSPSPFAASSSPAPTSSGNGGNAAAQSRASEASSSAASSIAGKVPPYVNALATPNRLLPPTPLSNATDRTSAASTSAASTSGSASKPVLLPTPYKAPRLAQSGASESFATAYPTQETRQKYASPAKPLPSASGTPLSHKRSWQSSGSVDLSNKKLRPSGAAVSSPATPASSLAASTAPSNARSASAAAGVNRPGVTASGSARPLSAAPAIGTAANTSSGITVTNIPNPGSALSKQAGVAPIDLTPAVSGTELPASTRDEYLSLLQKSELIDLVKQLETQLLDLIAAPAGTSTLYRQACIYPSQIHSQIDRLKARQSLEASKPASATDWSLKDIYSLLNSSTSTSNSPSFARTPGALPRPVIGRPAVPSSTLPRRPPTSTATQSVTPRTATAAGQKTAAADMPQNASLNSIINSINAMVRQQAQPARGPNGAPLPPVQKPAPASATRTASATSGKTRPAAGTAPTITPAVLRSIVGDGPMPSNAALAAAIAAHFGGKLPANAGTGARASNSTPTANVSTTNPQPATASRAPAAGPSKDISDKIAAILGSTSSSKPTMLGPQGLPLAPAATASNGAGSLPIGNMAVMLSSFAGQGSSSNSAGSPGAKNATPAADGSALSSLLQQFEEAKRRLPAAPSTASRAAPGSNAPAVQDPVAILTGASANPAFTPTFSAGAGVGTSALPSGTRDASWSPDPEPVIVQGPLGTSTLPSYEDMIVEGLRVMGEAPPRTLFNWMQDTYPLMKKFRPSAHQALQKAFKRGRLLKTGSMYRINPNWSEPGDSRKPTRRPQVGRDHPMVTPGLNGEVLAVSPLKDSQAYRNVGDAGLRALSKGLRLGPRPYGQPGAAPLANPASSIFQNGSAASIILEYQKRTGKKLDADSVKQLYPLIRSGPSDGPAEEMLAHLLTQTGYHDEAATARAAAAAQTAAAAMSASMPNYAQPTTLSAQIPSAMRTGGAAASRTAHTLVAKGPTSLPLPSTSEPTMMQQLASMLNDLSSPINPVLANSLLGQLSSNAAAAAAARAANMSGMNTGPQLPAASTRTAMPPAPSAATSASSQLASALSSLARQPQQDLDSAVSETLAAALQQIGAAPAGASGPASGDISVQSAAQETAANKPSEAAEEGDTVEEAATAGESGDAEEGINLAEYEDAIRALTSAFGGSGENAENDDSDESDVEADERAIAAAEAEPDSVIEESAAESAPRRGEGSEAQASEAVQEQQRQGEAEEGEAEEEDDEEEAEQMDLSAVLRQLTASLQAHQEGEANAQHEDSQEQEEGSSGQVAQETSDQMDVDPQPGEMQSDDNVKAADTEQAEAAQETHTADQNAEEEGDAAGLQAQLEALVASLAANAGNANDEDDDEEEEEEEGGDEVGGAEGDKN